MSAKTITNGHRFFCIQCGRETIPLQRKVCKMKEKFHRKKLYCPWCKMTLNAIECRNEQEVKEFKELYEKGEFKDEVEESLHISGSPWLW